MKGKHKLARALRVAAAALLLVACALALTACGGKKIDASSLISVQFQGLNGEGRAVLAFDREKLISALSQEKALTERQTEALNQLTSDLQKDYSVSKREGLSNGDTVEIAGALDKNLLKDLGFGINNDTVKLTVEGLIDPLELSAVDYIILETSGFDGYGEAYAYFDGAAFYEAVSARWAELYPDRAYEDVELLDSYRACARGVGVTLDRADGYANGDAVTGEITVTDPEIPECGVTVVGGAYSGVVSGLAEPETVDVASAVTMTFSGTVPDVRVQYEVDYSLPFVRYTSLYNMDYASRERLHNGDTFTLEIACDEEQMRANGFIPSNTTAEATVEGLNSYDFTLEGPDDPLLAELAAEGYDQVDEAFKNNYGVVHRTLLADREGWVQWGSVSVELIGEALAARDDDNGVENELFLIYRTAAPVRMADGTVESGACYTLLLRRCVMLTPDNALVSDYNWSSSRFSSMDELDEAIAYEVANRLREGATVARVDAEIADIDLPESDFEPALADMTTEAVETLAIGELTPDYANRIETWETMTDPYGAEHENVLALRVGDSARVDYLLDGLWDRFTGTLSTYNEAGTEAKMSMYIWGDGRLLYAVDGYQRSRMPEPFALDVRGVRRLSIQTACYGRNDHAWLFICDGQLEATGEEQVPGALAVPLSDMIIGDSRDVDDYAWSSMTTDALGNVLRDGYRFNSERESLMRVNLGGAYTYFSAEVSVAQLPNYDPDTSVRLDVLADGVQVASIEGISIFAAQQAIDLDVSGVDVLEFRASEENDTGRMYIFLGNTLLTGEAPAEAEVEANTAAGAEYAEIDYALLREIEGDDAQETPLTFACDNYLYLLVNRSMNYAQAKYAAQRLGGTLAMPKTNRQNAALTALIEQAPGDRYWLGARRQTPNSETWVWNDGEIVTDMSHWNSDEPNNTDGRENTAMIYNNGAWNDIPGENEMRFVVQLPVVSGGIPEDLTALADLPIPAIEDAKLVRETIEGVYDPMVPELNARNQGWASFELDGRFAELTAELYVHPESDVNARTSVAVFGDGKLLYQANNLRRSDPIHAIRVDVTGVSVLKVMARETAGGGNSWIDLPFAWLTEADAPVDGQAVEAATLEAVDARGMSIRRKLAFDAAGGVQPGWIELNAADEGYVMYNLNGGFTSVTGAVCAGEESADGETLSVRVLVDGREACVIEGIAPGDPAQTFEADLTGAGTLRIEAGRDGGNWKNFVYIAGLTLR